MKPPYPAGYLPRLLSAAAYVAAAAEERRRTAYGLSPEADLLLSLLVQGPASPEQLAAAAAAQREVVDPALRELVCHGFAEDREADYVLTPAGRDACAPSGGSAGFPDTEMRSELLAIIRRLGAGAGPGNCGPDPTGRRIPD